MLPRHRQGYTTSSHEWFFRFVIGILALAIISGIGLGIYMRFSDGQETSNVDAQEKSSPEVRDYAYRGVPSRASLVREFESELRKHGLPLSEEYPYWPLVYDRDVEGRDQQITGKIYNYGSKPVKNIRVEFELSNSYRIAVGFAKDEVSQIPSGGIWNYKCPVFDRYEYLTRPMIFSEDITGDPR